MVGQVSYQQGIFSWLLTTTGCLVLPGLQVILYINEEEYNPFLVSSTGAKVIVHRQDEYPFTEDVGTEIETAMATSIGMHLVREHSDFHLLGKEDRFYLRIISEVELMEKGIGFKRKHSLVFSNDYANGHSLSYSKGCLYVFCMDEQGQDTI